MTHEKALETSRKDENINPTDIVGGARGLSVSRDVQIFASISKPKGGLKAALMGSEISLKLQNVKTLPSSRDGSFPEEILLA